MLALRINRFSPVPERPAAVVVRRNRGVILADPQKFLEENEDCTLIKTDSPEGEPLLAGVHVLGILCGLEGKSPEVWAKRWLYKRTNKPGRIYPLVWTDSIRKEVATSVECMAEFKRSTKRRPAKKAGRVKTGWSWGQSI